MPRILKYRSIGLILAVLFCLFNVGLPIVVASCPMMGAMKCPPKACCAAPDTKSVKLGSVINRDCCKTVFAASRNTNEFLQVPTILHENAAATQFVAVFFGDVLLHAQSSLVITGLSGDSPPSSSGDLPVLYSSLLI